MITKDCNRTKVANEFHAQEPSLKLGQNIEFLVGAVFWGIGADIWGQRSVLLCLHLSFVYNNLMKVLLLRLSFNLTLFITGVFGIATGGAPDFITVTALTAVFSVGVGGNLPVDSAIFLGVYSLSEGIAGTIKIC
jgi:hypothetical protein